MVLATALVPDQNRGTAILGHKQVCGAVIIVVAGEDGAGVFQFELVQPNFRRDILEAIGAKITKQSHLAFALLGFTCRYQVDPAVVVIVDGVNAVTTYPGGRGKAYLLKSL